LNVKKTYENCLGYFVLLILPILCYKEKGKIYDKYSLLLPVLRVCL